MGEIGSDGENVQGQRSAQGQAGAATIAGSGPLSRINAGGGQGHISGGGGHTWGSTTGPCGCGCFKGAYLSDTQGHKDHLSVAAEILCAPPRPRQTLFAMGKERGKREKKKRKEKPG